MLIMLQTSLEFWLQFLLPEKVKSNIEMATKQMPDGFWDAMVAKGLLENKNFFKKNENS